MCHCISLGPRPHPASHCLPLDFSFACGESLGMRLYATVSHHVTDAHCYVVDCGVIELDIVIAPIDIVIELDNISIQNLTSRTGVYAYVLYHTINTPHFLYFNISHLFISHHYVIPVYIFISPVVCYC